MDGPGFRGNRDVAIHVKDVIAAEAFYSGTLGFPVVLRAPDHLAIETGSFRLWVNRAPTGQLGFIPSFDVTDLAGARAALERAGCSIERESGDGSGFYVRDPFGFLIDVIGRS